MIRLLSLFVFSNTSSLPCFLAVADRMCRSGAVDLICIDSVSALTPRAEIEVIVLLLYLFLFSLLFLFAGVANCALNIRMIAQ